MATQIDPLADWEEFPCPYEDKPKILSVFAAARSEISSHETIRPARLELC